MPFYELLEKYKNKSKAKCLQKESNILEGNRTMNIEPAVNQSYTEDGPTKEYKKPHLNGQNDLVIPFDSDPKYHWWQGSQDIVETLLEIGASDEVIKRYYSSFLKAKENFINLKAIRDGLKEETRENLLVL